MTSKEVLCLQVHQPAWIGITIGSGHIVVLRDRVQRFSSIPTRCVTQTLSRCAAHKGTGFHFPEKEMNWGQLMISETLPGSKHHNWHQAGPQKHGSC